MVNIIRISTHLHKNLTKQTSVQPNKQCRLLISLEKILSKYMMGKSNDVVNILHRYTLYKYTFSDTPPIFNNTFVANHMMADSLLYIIIFGANQFSKS